LKLTGKPRVTGKGIRKPKGRKWMKKKKEHKMIERKRTVTLGTYLGTPGKRISRTPSGYSWEASKEKSL